MKKFIASIGVYALPAVGLAATNLSSTGLDGFFNQVSLWIGQAVPIIIALAVLFYLWEGFQYFWGDDDRKTAAKKVMWEGIIVLAVLISVWGLVNFIRNTFGLSNDRGDVDTAIQNLVG